MTKQKPSLKYRRRRQRNPQHREAQPVNKLPVAVVNAFQTRTFLNILFMEHLFFKPTHVLR